MLAPDDWMTEASMLQAAATGPSVLSKSALKCESWSQSQTEGIRTVVCISQDAL
jgi:hypothetical protein